MHVYEFRTSLHNTMLISTLTQHQSFFFYLNLISFIHEHVSMGLCKKDITPLVTRWSYVFLALTHRYVFVYMRMPTCRMRVIFIYIYREREKERENMSFCTIRFPTINVWKKWYQILAFRQFWILLSFCETIQNVHANELFTDGILLICNKAVVAKCRVLFCQSYFS